MQAAGEAALVLSTACQMQVDGHPVWKGFGQGKGDLFPITGDALLHCRRITSGGFLQGELVRPVGEKSHRHGAAADQRQQHHPEGGLPVMKHSLHPLPDSHLSESQRTGGNHSGVNTGHQESLGIVGPLHALHPADDLLVTCQFQIPTEQQVGQPHQRVEPVHRQNQKTQWLPPMVPAGDVGILMGQNRLLHWLRQMVGQIDAGTKQAHNKGRGDKFTLKNRHLGMLHPDSSRNPLPQPEIAHTSIQQHPHHSGQPDEG